MFNRHYGASNFLAPAIVEYPDNTPVPKAAGDFAPIVPVRIAITFSHIVFLRRARMHFVVCHANTSYFHFFQEQGTRLLAFYGWSYGPVSGVSPGQEILAGHDTVRGSRFRGGRLAYVFTSWQGEQGGETITIVAVVGPGHYYAEEPTSNLLCLRNPTALTPHRFRHSSQYLASTIL